MIRNGSLVTDEGGSAKEEEAAIEGIEPASEHVAMARSVTAGSQHESVPTEKVVLKIPSRVDDEEPQYPDACLPDHWYEKLAFLKGKDESPFWQGWSLLRLKTFRLIENKYFETAVIIMILLSSLALVSPSVLALRRTRLTETHGKQALEDIYLSERPILQDILYYMDRIFTVIFFIEMLIKWLALGFKNYFTNAWCWLDFIIVMVRIVRLVRLFTAPYLRPAAASSVRRRPEPPFPGQRRYRSPVTNRSSASFAESGPRRTPRTSEPRLITRIALCFFFSFFIWARVCFERAKRTALARQPGGHSGRRGRHPGVPLDAHAQGAAPAARRVPLGGHACKCRVHDSLP